MPRAPLFVDLIPVPPERDASAFARLTVFERMGDGRRRWVRDRSVRDLSARQRGIRIDLEGDGDQRRTKMTAKVFMVGVCRARLRPNRSNISTKPGNTLEQVPMLLYLCLRCVSLLDRVTPVSPASFRSS